jgi:asparagine synthase (glutamine-hydrolysing)
MCGIAGVLRLDGRPVDRAALERMNRAQAHRGPDGEGLEILGPCGLGHRRLAIVDLSEAGHQPMATADGQLWISYNGEVYDHVELRRTLEGRGHVFRSRTDTEVILAAYREWGTGCFERFNGMWGLALWDASRRRLVLARDRLGIKPLYVARDADRLLFASEVKALLAAEPALARLDREQVARFVARPALGCGRRSFFEGIESVDPGTVQIHEADGRSRRERFWSFVPPPPDESQDERRCVETIGARLEDAVRLRFRADVPVGTCLSGGLDSSSIVALAAGRLGKAPDTFSALYDDAGHVERPFVEVMERHFGLAAHHVQPDGTDLPGVLERITWHQDAPSSGPGVYSQWHVMRIAQPRVKVLLDGQGGDEVLGGYTRFYEPYVRGLLSRARRGDVAAGLEAARAVREIRAATGQDPLAGLVRAARRRLSRALPLGAAGGPATPLATEAGLLVAEDLAGVVRAETGETGIRRHSGDPLTDTMWDALTRTSIPTLLHYEDRDSMAFSIEARTPFLDYRLVEAAFTLPTRLKIRGALTKVALRASMEGLLPEPVRDRRDKLGFPTPFARFLRADGGGWIRAILQAPAARDRGLLAPSGVARLLDEHLGGTADHGWRLYQLATLELFARVFVDRSTPGEPP